MPIQGLTTSNIYGVELTFWPLNMSTIFSIGNWIHHLRTEVPLAPYFCMFLCVSCVKSRFGLARAKVGLVLAMQIVSNASVRPYSGWCLVRRPSGFSYFFLPLPFQRLPVLG